MRVAMLKVLNRSIDARLLIEDHVFFGDWLHYMDRLFGGIRTPGNVPYHLTLLPTIHVLVISLAEVGEERLGGSQMATKVSN